MKIRKKKIKSYNFFKCHDPMRFLGISSRYPLLSVFSCCIDAQWEVSPWIYKAYFICYFCFTVTFVFILKTSYSLFSTVHQSTSISKTKMYLIILSVQFLIQCQTLDGKSPNKCWIDIYIYRVNMWIYTDINVCIGWYVFVRVWDWMQFKDV